MKKLIVVALACAFLAVNGYAQSTLAQAQSLPEVRQRTFEIVWSTVKEKHFDPTFGGVDWDKVHADYAPRVSSAKSDSEFYALLQQMLGELGQSHFNIFPPDSVLEDPEEGDTSGVIGIDVQMVDDQALITRVEAGSKAAAAGLKPGYIIKKIGTTTVAELAAKQAKSKESESIKRLRLTRSVMTRVDGAPGSTVTISFIDEQEREREVAVTRVRQQGELSPKVGNFPSRYLEFEARRIDKGIGYIRFNIFLTPLMERIREAIRSMQDAPGIIIDLRGNPGGFGGMSSGIAGMLTKEKFTFGTMKMRAGHTNFIAYPQTGAFLGPVVVLLDNGSASTSEVFASGLQELGRAVIVGERSAGAALPSVIEKLPTGALFQYATADFKTPKGVLIEGRGVVPDVEVKMERRRLLSGRDPQLDAAIEQITKMKGQL